MNNREFYEMMMEIKEEEKRERNRGLVTDTEQEISEQMYNAIEAKVKEEFGDDLPEGSYDIIVDEDNPLEIKLLIHNPVEIMGKEEEI